MKKHVCLKSGCRFVTESEYEAEQHQKQGPKHDIFVIETDYSGNVRDMDMDKDIE